MPDPIKRQMIDPGLLMDSTSRVLNFLEKLGVSSANNDKMCETLSNDPFDPSYIRDFLSNLHMCARLRDRNYFK